MLWLVVGVHVADAGSCSRIGNRVLVLTPLEMAVAPKGTLLVGLGPWSGTAIDYVDSRSTATPDGLPPAVQLNGQALPPSERLAPGLYRIPIPDLIGPTLELVGAEGAAKLEVSGAAPGPGDLPAPLLRKLERGESLPDPFGATHPELYAVLDGEPPTEALAIILYVEREGAWQAIQWAPKSVDDGRQALRAHLVYCEGKVAGFDVPAGGERVSAAWVDALGAVSPRSAVVTAP